MKLLRSVLLEGPDGAGKSSLYDRMTQPVAYGGWGLRSSGHDGRNPDTAAEGWERLAMFAAGAPCIRDRSFCVSELVYAPIMNREMIVESAKLKKFLVTYSPFLIYCRPDTEVILKAPVKAKPGHKPEDFAEEIRQKRQAIVDGYDRLIPELVDSCQLDHVKYNWKKDPMGVILREVLIGMSVCAA